MTKQGGEKYIIRFPAGWRDVIKAEAAKAHHSMNAEILNAIQTAMRTRGVQLEQPTQK